MKTFEVSLTYTATTVIRVDAQDLEQAKAQAWEELASDGSYASDYGDWTLDNVTESKPQEAL